MARNSAVEAVTGEVFREGWDRVRGSMQGLNSKRAGQLYRAARGHRAAVFKAIKNGGTHTKGQLSNQLSYITRDNKLSHFVDSRGTFDGKTKFDEKDIKKLTDRFAERWDSGFRPKMGNTTHMLMSFPKGTRSEDVRDIASDVCERFFETDEGHFDYVIAVHKDRDHPHAHIVLNRRSQEGEFFYLGRDHRFNYDDFRLAMVEEAEKYGVKLEATRRIDRGVVHYAPRTREVYAVKEDAAKGIIREPAPRERVGKDLARTLAEIASTRIVYHSLAAEASQDSREEIAQALQRAAELLGNGSQVEQDGDVYMGVVEDFDELKSRYADTVEEVQARIAGLPEGQRAQKQRDLNQLQAGVRRMQPLGLRSATLEQRPSDGGIYSELNINSELTGRLNDGTTRAQIDNALRGTGINTETVVNRIETGAPNAALEQQWVADDLSKVAQAQGLNLERKDDLEAAREWLNQVHVELGVTLERAEVLRDDGVIEEAREIRFHFDQEQFDETTRAIRQELRGQGVNEAQLEARAVEIENRAFDRIEAEQQSYLETRPEILSDPGAVYRTDEEGRGRITDQELADRLDREIEIILDRAPANQSISEAVASDFKDRYPDMPDHVTRGLGDTYETSFRLNNEQELREAELEAADIATVREHALEATRLANGIAQAEADGMSVAERRELVSEIETNVREGWSEDDRAYTDDRFEQLVIERDRLEAKEGSVQRRVSLATEFSALSAARQSGQLTADEAQRADVLLRDTADRYGIQMRDGLVREDTREFQDWQTNDPEGERAMADRFEAERLERFDADLARVRGDVTAERDLRAMEIDQTSLDRMSSRVRDEIMSENADTQSFDQRYERAEAMAASGAIEQTSRARILQEREEYLSQRPELAAERVLPYSDVPFGAKIEDRERVDQISREVDRVMADRDNRGDISRAVADDFRARYPDMPDHLARGLGRTYEIANEARDREAIRDVAGTRIENEEIRRVVEHERSDDVSPSLATDEQGLIYREQIEQELDDEQIERLRGGDSDTLENVSDDRLDRLYAAKAYLQSDSATANSEAYREVVQEIAEEQYELQKDRLVDSEREGGPVHG
ncbi:relaxase/mobilization nuclease-like protein [Litoreibacter meonggei]|uniref:Relaxase/mobilization nuclease-like protein n=2 Tax=Rhodobacterales TaxID=204455 RepID=A0A497VUX9_9RHOB|nr:relaxase/mobilization nuclease domain-containing protein [Litoreibacter meonggei]RLJ40663.1 relaxase/mobilization nuclease-like protein [Litoreibacter meonggei]